MRSKRQVLVVTGLSAVSVLLIGIMILALVSLIPSTVQAQALSATQAQDTSIPTTASLQTEPALPRTITVVGEGRVRMKPDIAQINIGIEVVGDTVKGTSSEAASTMEAVMASLQAQGVDEKDMQTSGYNVWVERPYGPEGMPTDEVRYHVGNTVMVTIRDLDTVGTVLDAAIEAGANNIYGVTFSAANPGSLMSEARETAVADALAKAQELAELNNVTLGEVISISEVISPGGLYVGGIRSAAAFAEGMGGGGGGPISPGELEMTTQLQITYAIN
jgi:uncharacterized protein YggE